MIPLTLTLENFKCYRRDVPTLRLEGVHIACLCGANGHGKSSLLDAMCWALWGEAVHRPQEELVHLGEQDMRVEMEFLAGGTESTPGHQYRVIRRYSRGRGARAGATSLELQVASGDASFQSISGDSVRETEAAIRRLVGMDYDTFVNSAFLVQGRADEFTNKRPAERQRVLAETLGLSLYERLQERARQKAREHAADLQRRQGQLQAWAQDLARRPEYERELPGLVATLDQSQAQLAEAQRASDSLKERIEALRATQRELDGLRRQHHDATEELEQLRSQATQHTQRILAWEKLTARDTEIRQAYGQLVERRSREEAMGRLLEPYARLQERRRPLSQLVESLPSLERALAEAQQALSALEQRQRDSEAHAAELQDIQVKQQVLQTENQNLHREMVGLRQRVDMLVPGGARCPLCGTELGEEGRKHIQTEYEAQGRLLAQRYRQNEATLKDLEPEATRLSWTVAKEDKELAEASRRWHSRMGTVSQRLEEAGKAPAELEALDQELHRLGYDPTAHREVKEAMLKLAWAEEQHGLLQYATEGLPGERESLKRVTALAQRREETMAQIERRMAAIAAEVETLPSLERQMESVGAQLQALEEQQGELRSRRGFLQTRLKEYQETEAQIAQAETELQTIAQEREVLEQLATAFGRTGVQALLVEAAIPDLEAEANRLLGRMTDNTMHLKLETQRENQRGETVETLEIKVADPLGTRSYETFSGGEAFRINLALRIGLSKLLAHRAGAPLPTLFIDEGFGTQDAAGRERILEVVQSIAEDFQRILVVTHMEEVKDAFPVRIEVTKTPNGSTFALT